MAAWLLGERGGVAATLACFAFTLAISKWDLPPWLGWIALGFALFAWIAFTTERFA
jgi:hypothetical protein